MKRDDAVLEANLRALFQRSYAPVLPAVAFRARLLAALAHPPARAERALSVRRLALAALLLVGLGLALWRVLPARALDCDAILATGSSALCEEPGRWRALRPDEELRGVESQAAALELALAPARASERLWVGGHGSVALEDAARLALERRPDLVALELARGRARFERLQAEVPWRVHTSFVDFELDTGRLVLEHDPDRSELRARLEAGRARYGSERQELPLDRTLCFRAGSAVRLEAEDEASARVALSGVGQAPAEAADAQAAVPGLAFEGRLLAADGTPWSAAFTLVALREERLPAVAHAITLRCEGTEGRFRFPVARAGRYTLFALAPGQATLRRVGLEARADATPLELVLQPGLSLRGRVVDAATGAPIAGALVLSEDDTPAQLLPFDSATLPAELQARALSDQQGVFVLERLSPGVHTLRASAPGRAAGWSPRVDARAPAGELVITLDEGAALEVALEPARAGVTIVASAIDYSFQRPCLSFSIATSDARGEVRFDHLPGGPFVVLRADASSPADVSQVTLGSGKVARVVLGGARGAARLAGRLLDESGEPLADWDLMLQPPEPAGAPWNSTRSDAEGRFGFEGLPTGPQIVYVGQGLGRDFVEVARLELAAGETARDLQLPPAGIHGVVRTAEGRDPLPFGWLVVQYLATDGWTFAGKAQADERGAWRFRGLRAGTWRVVAYAPVERLAPAIGAPVALRAGDGSHELELALERGARLELCVRDARGEPQAGALLAFTNAAGERMQFSPCDQSDAAGRLVLPGIAPGRWTVRATKAGFGPAEQTLTLDVDENATLELTLGPR